MIGRHPARFRQHLGVSVICASPAALVAASPALAAPLSAEAFIGAAPLALTLGAIGVSLISAYMLRRAKMRGTQLARSAQNDLAEIRAELDLTQSILDGMDELTLIWRDTNAPPTVSGQASIVHQSARDRDFVADFRNWLAANDSIQLSRLATRLKADALGFDVSMTTIEGKLMRISGRVLGGAAVIRIRPASNQDAPASERHAIVPALSAADISIADSYSAEYIFNLVSKPAWLRDAKGRLTYANKAYRQLAQSAGATAVSGDIPELFGDVALREQASTALQAQSAITIENKKIAERTYDVVLFPTETGTAGFLRPKVVQSAQSTSGSGQSAHEEAGSGIIDAIALPVAIFDNERRIKHFNQAYCDLWDLDPEWLRTGVEESVILDRLRTNSQLPPEADYRVWRAKHLESYKLSAPREEPWYLPDGRTLSVVSVPNARSGGVIYVFENITEQLALESRYNALINVQSETLSALNEGVAVFGTNGKLTLSNPRLSALWKLPMNELGQHPHIDQIAQFCAAAMPEDGASIWQDLKQNIVDLNPARTDRSGRLTRADGRMIDYTVTRLPDGQTMMTFTDVTESANYQKVLKERNDALVTADRLKDAFVQNVSYELRSPLTNIIGFADLLASDETGELNEKQKTYTGYIRASSQTLGVLIDNILDLATADAGVAELNLAPQDIPALVERAKAGLIGTLTAGGDETPPDLTVEIAPDLPEFIADGTRIVQVLYNLLSNAVRFSASGTPVRLTIASRGSHIMFTVEDEGVGISEEMRAAVFQRFEGKSAEGRQRGAGLGLAIVKTFVNLHGGTISLERREPKGTRVIVSIPANPAEAVSAAE